MTTAMSILATFRRVRSWLSNVRLVGLALKSRKIQNSNDPSENFDFNYSKWQTFNLNGKKWQIDWIICKTSDLHLIILSVHLRRSGQISLGFAVPYFSHTSRNWVWLVKQSWQNYKKGINFFFVKLCLIETTKVGLGLIVSLWISGGIVRTVLTFKTVTVKENS